MNDLELTAAPLFAALVDAVQRCLESPGYRALGTRPAPAGSGSLAQRQAPAGSGSLAQRQARMIAVAICDASHDELEGFPPFAELRSVIHIQRRNACIVQDFTGHNYGDLARQWSLSTRQVRRIVAGARKNSDRPPLQMSQPKTHNRRP